MKTVLMTVILLAGISMFTGCHSAYPNGGCADGNCGLIGHLNMQKDKHLRLLTGRCNEKGCPADPNANSGFAPGYASGMPGNASGPLAEHLGQNFRGHQSHMGAYPGPAMGAPSPTVTYPYYTVRGPRDFLVDHPTSIGR